MGKRTVSSRLVRGLTVVSIVFATSWCGCAEPQDVVVEAPQTVAMEEMPEPVPDPTPQLAAARDRDISLFGEIPMRPEVPYFTRTATALTQHTFSEEGADFDPIISRDGKLLVFSSTRHNVSPAIYAKAVDGVAVTQLTADPAADVQPALSPDGTRIAFASNRGGNWDIWVVGMEGQPPIQITSGPNDDVHPSWSPDGTQIVYSSLPQRGQWELWLADVSTGGKKRFFGYGLFPEWSPTGNTILFQRARERGSRWFSVWTMQLINGEPRYPTEIAASSEAALITPSWNGDGSQIAYSAVTPSAEMDETLEPMPETADIWIVDIDGKSRVKLTDGHTSNFSPTWSPDGRVFFTSSREGRETVWSLKPLGSEASPSGMTASSEASALPSVLPSDSAGG